MIIFVNGIFGDAKSTWQNTDGAYWPELLAEDPDFHNADVYVHSFNSPKISKAQQIDELASRLKDYLTTDHVLEHKQLILVCHSMGGLVTRAFLLKQRLPPAQVPMIYFFATPTAGAAVTEIAHHLSENPQLRDMLPLADGGYVKTLREQWLQTSNEPQLNYPNTIASFCAYELLNTYHVKIVPELSATYLCNRETRSVQADHIGIVKPRDERDEPYVYFKAAYLRTFGPAAQPIASVVQTAMSQPVVSERRAFPISVSGPEQLTLKQTKATSTYIDVGCEEDRRGEIQAHVDLADDERVVDIRPAIGNAVNIKASSVAVVQHSGSDATVQYFIRGLDRQFFNCPGGGHADVVVNFIVARGNVATPPR